jgi:hypothetical protein
MSELEFFSLTGVLTQNFNTVVLTKILEFKKKKTSHSDHSSQIEDDIMQNHEREKKVKKVKNKDSMNKTNFFLAHCPLALG